MSCVSVYEARSHALFRIKLNLGNPFVDFRIEYDAYRSELELMLQLPKSEGSAAKIEEAQRNFNIYKISYEKLRDDVNVKLQFLDENRVSILEFKSCSVDMCQASATRD